MRTSSALAALLAPVLLNCANPNYPEPHQHPIKQKTEVTKTKTYLKLEAIPFLFNTNAPPEGFYEMEVPTERKGEIQMVCNSVRHRTDGVLHDWLNLEVRLYSSPGEPLIGMFNATSPLGKTKNYPSEILEEYLAITNTRFQMSYNHPVILRGELSKPISGLMRTLSLDSLEVGFSKVIFNEDFSHIVGTVPCSSSRPVIPYTTNPLTPMQPQPQRFFPFPRN